jgi:hypothetical protein
MRVRVLSVPHTGTRFITEVLRNAGLDVVQVHFNGMYAPVIWENKVPPIVPIRDKQATIDSWTRRDRHDPPFDKTWQEMEEFVEDFEPLEIHIDNPARREDDLKAISEQFGVPLEADFSVKVGHFAG